MPTRNDIKSRKRYRPSRSEPGQVHQPLQKRTRQKFSEEDRLFFEQIKEKASKEQQVIEPALANPKDKFMIGIRKLIEGLLIQRLGENDKIVTRYVEDQDFQNIAFDGLANEIFASVVAEHS